MQRTAVVTGGAGGIGGGIVRSLAEAGHKVAILDRVGEFAVDLADEQAVRDIARRIGPRDVLVHAAAAFDRAGLGEIDLAIWRHVQAVNVEAALWLSQALTPAMVERGFGRIIFITSNTVWRPPADDFLPYVASKATLVGIARHAGAAARSARDHGQLCGPGTDPHGVHRGGPATGAFREVLARQSLPRSLMPDDVAGVVAFLASDAAAAITGQTLCADGGSVFV